MGNLTHDPRHGGHGDVTGRCEQPEPDSPAGEAEDVAAGDALSRLLSLAAPRPPIPAQRAARVEAAVRLRWLERVRARRRRVATTVAAAVVAIALGVAAWWWVAAPRAAVGEPVARIERVVGRVLQDGGSDGSRPLAAGEWLAAGVTLETGELGRAALRLGAGASLRLDRSTRVRMIGRGRIELLTGGLYVDSPGGSEDLRVDTRWGQVRELGTQFEVRTAGDGVQLRVREGSVELQSGNATHQVPSGVELAMTSEGRLSRHAIAPHAQEWDWVASIAPPFALDGSTLGEFLAWVSRETGREILFADPELESTAPALVLGGAVEELSPAQALLAVLPTCGLEHRLEDEAFVLVRSRS
ncbi:MAG TPA: FecR family protein [Thermoanaerobaculia bacterium]|nr:FecR family protein [Thermoanaerobaculia bacterium]